MFCPNCGSQVGDNDKFCKACGTPVNVQAAPVVQQPAPQPIPQPVPQPAPVAYQQPAPVAPQAVPTTAKVKAGPRRSCFIVGLITCILLLIETVPMFAIGGMMFMVVGPIAMMFGASSSDDLFAYGLLICLVSFILMDAAIISIVFNSISSKITSKRPASKCRRFRTVAAIMTFIDSVVVVAPVIVLNYAVSDSWIFYALFAVTFIMAGVFLALALITNSKEKKFESV